MSLIRGLTYNFRGLAMGLRTPRLLALGLIRFVLIAAVSAAAVGAVLAYHEPILGLLWSRPSAGWLLWLWQAVSWLLAVVLAALSVVAAYLVSQVLFSVVIMDRMSRITERLATGAVAEPAHLGWWRQLGLLVRQEIPRTLLPVAFTLGLTVVGWFTPLGPVATVVLSMAAVIFIAWDNTDLTPARRLQPFAERFAFLRRTLGFHLGFGLPFLVPVANLLFLAFAPVGATLFYLDYAGRRRVAEDRRATADPGAGR